jgi:hypothetical protein
VKVVESRSHISTQVQGCSISRTWCVCVRRCTELWLWIHQSHVRRIGIWLYTYTSKLQRTVIRLPFMCMLIYVYQMMVEGFVIIKPIRCTNFSNLSWKWNSTCFGQFLCPSSGVIQCTLSNCICHTGLWTAFEQQDPDPAARRLSLWYIPLLSVQWTTPDDGKRNWPNHVEFHFQNKFEKLVLLVGFITRICHDVRSHECKRCLKVFLFFNGIQQLDVWCGYRSFPHEGGWFVVEMRSKTYACVLSLLYFVTRFRCEPQYVSNLFKLLRYPHANNLNIKNFHP